MIFRWKMRRIAICGMTLMRSAIRSMSGVMPWTVPIVECRAPYKMYLDTVKYRQEVINLIDDQVNNFNQYAGLKFGSLEGGNNESGNWGE